MIQNNSSHQTFFFSVQITKTNNQIKTAKPKQNLNKQEQQVIKTLAKIILNLLRGMESQMFNLP